LKSLIIIIDIEKNSFLLMFDCYCKWWKVMEDERGVQAIGRIILASVWEGVLAVVLLPQGF
jgi:hypothetical protein